MGTIAKKTLIKLHQGLQGIGQFTGQLTILGLVASSCPCQRFDRMASMVRTLELALSKAAELPEAAQEQFGREILERLDALAELRAELEIGIRELDAGLGEPLDIEEVIAQARKEHGKASVL